jgi:hypothetical protein
MQRCLGFKVDRLIEHVTHMSVTLRDVPSRDVLVEGRRPMNMWLIGGIETFHQRCLWLKADALNIHVLTLRRPIQRWLGENRRSIEHGFHISVTLETSHPDVLVGRQMPQQNIYSHVGGTQTSRCFLVEGRRSTEHTMLVTLETSHPEMSWLADACSRTCYPCR